MVKTVKEVPKKLKIQYVFSGNEKTVKNNTSQIQHLDAKKQSVFASHEKTVKTYCPTRLSAVAAVQRVGLPICGTLFKRVQCAFMCQPMCALGRRAC